MSTVIVVDSARVEEGLLREPARLLREGRVVAFPTDTLYGLAVDPRNAAAVRRLYALKGRAEGSALPLIAADLAQAERCAVFDEPERALAATWWPGPLTVVATARSEIARRPPGGWHDGRRARAGSCDCPRARPDVRLLHHLNERQSIGRSTCGRGERRARGAA